MPIYTFECQNKECNFLLDEEYYDSMEELPHTCPNCKQETLIRIIDGTAAVRVELYGQELYQKLRGEGLAIKKQACRNENTLANLVGNDKYQANVKAFGG